MRRLGSLGAALVVAGALASCASAVSGAKSPAAPTPTATPTPGPVTAAQVYQSLVSDGLPLSGLIVYTAATDPNHLLGRPNGYTSKCAWVDSRIPASDVTGLVKGDPSRGGSVEVFPTAAGAVARAKEILTLEKALPNIGSEYDYLDGGVLIRLSEYLTPAQAATYGAAFHATLYTDRG